MGRIAECAMLAKFAQPLLASMAPAVETYRLRLEAIGMVINIRIPHQANL